MVWGIQAYFFDFPAIEIVVLCVILYFSITAGENSGKL
jgi:hypothetical protein